MSRTTRTATATAETLGEAAEPASGAATDFDPTNLEAQQSPAAEITAAPPTGNGQGAQSEGQSPPAGHPDWVKRASVIADPLAGTRFHFNYETHRAAITFDEKPTAEVRTLLKNGSYEWNRQELAWSCRFPSPPAPRTGRTRKGSSTRWPTPSGKRRASSRLSSRSRISQSSFDPTTSGRRQFPASGSLVLFGRDPGRRGVLV